MSDVNAVPETEAPATVAEVPPVAEAPAVAEANEGPAPATGADVKAALLHVLDGFNNYSLAVGFQRIADLLAQ